MQNDSLNSAIQVLFEKREDSDIQNIILIGGKKPHTFKAKSNDSEDEESSP